MSPACFLGTLGGEPRAWVFGLPLVDLLPFGEPEEEQVEAAARGERLPDGPDRAPRACGLRGPAEPEGAAGGGGGGAPVTTMGGGVGVDLP